METLIIFTISFAIIFVINLIFAIYYKKVDGLNENNIIKNSDLVNDLENYFKNTQREKVLDDWEKSKEFDSVNSPLMSEYIDIIEKLQTTNLIKNKNQNK